MANKTPLWKFAEQTPLGSQAQSKTKTATAQAQPVTSTPVKPAAPQDKASAQAQPQAPAQAQAQPHRPALAYFPQPHTAPPQGARCVPLESLDEDRLKVANFCELKRGYTENGNGSWA